MRLTQKWIGLVLLTLPVATAISGQENGSSKITAQEIIQRAIDNSGGDAKLDTVHAAEFISQLITADEDTLSIAIKVKSFNKYSLSTLSNTHVNSTTIFNEGHAVIIKNETVQKITDPGLLEDLSLHCFISIDYGYKKLGYKLSRLDDQKFKHFDCYVVMAASPLGKKTLNFYDKKTGNPVMIIYPNQNKTVFTDFYEKNGITCPSKLLLATQNKITQSLLQKINYQNDLDSNWFHLPGEGAYKAPDLFKTGSFKYINSNEGVGVARDKDQHIESDGQKKIVYKIKWSSDSDYLLFRLKNESNPPTNDNIELFKVRILAWNGNKYYCQYLNSDNIGGTCAFEKIK